MCIVEIEQKEMGDYLQNVKLLFFTNALIIVNDELIERETNRTTISFSVVER